MASRIFSFIISNCLSYINNGLICNPNIFLLSTQDIPLTFSLFTSKLTSLFLIILLPCFYFQIHANIYTFYLLCILLLLNITYYIFVVLFVFLLKRHLLLQLNQHYPQTKPLLFRLISMLLPILISFLLLYILLLSLLCMKCLNKHLPRTYFLTLSLLNYFAHLHNNFHLF